MKMVVVADDGTRMLGGFVLDLRRTELAYWIAETAVRVTMRSNLGMKGSAVAIETEAKFPVSDFEPVLGGLRRSRAESLGVFFHDDRFFDFLDRRLLHSDCGLRLRTVTASATEIADARHLLTYKGPREAGPTKRRTEVELTVSDLRAAVELLKELGLQQFLRFQKRRRRYCLRGCYIELDSLPLLGNFVEIEGPDTQAIAEVASLLALKMPDAVTDTYAQMFVAEVGRRGLPASQSEFLF